MSRQAEELLREAGALLDGHFELTSGRHSPIYVEKFRILEQPTYTARLCELIADRFRKDDVELVAAPTTGGIILSYEVARQLGVRGIFAEKSGVQRQFERGFRVARGERALVVDDVMTTGGSVREVITALREAGGEPLGVGVLVDRTGGRLEFGVPLYACLTLDLLAYESSACPLCSRGEPITRT